MLLPSASLRIPELQNLIEPVWKPILRRSLNGLKSTQSICCCNRIKKMISSIVDEVILCAINELLCKFFSQFVDNFTIVDLPGIINELQPELAADIRSLVQLECSKPNSIILVVHPATQEAVTLQGLPFAQRFDPTGFRTICAVTKLDMVKAPLTTFQQLRQSQPLQHGYFAVICRDSTAPDQFDLQSKAWLRSLDQQLSHEEEFCRTNLRHYAQSNGGTRALQKRLANLLQEQIRRDMDPLIERLRREAETLDTTLQQLGEPIPAAEVPARLEGLVRDFVQCLRDCFDGKPSATDTALESTSDAGAKLR